jgi:dTDP-4-amino-4,6-dideoxygalactose transaminase
MTENMNELAILGGTPVRTELYPDWPTSDESDVRAVVDALHSGRWGGAPAPGRWAKAFAERFAALQGARHAVVMMNGTITMEVALKALGIGWGDEVIVPALTFAATAYAPMAAGALPVIVDVEPSTWAMDPAALEAAITPRTRAIIPVHLGQVMADMDRIMAIAQRHSLAVIEDAAHSHGKQWRGRGAGTFGAFGSFSHQNTKILTAGEGGTLTTEDDRLAELATSLIDCGRAKDPDRQRFTFGANYRITELQAALLYSQLAKFETQMAERLENCVHFERLIADAAIPGVRLLEIDPRMTRRSFYRYEFAIEPEAFGGVTNDVVSRALKAEGVVVGVGYPSLSRDPLFQPSLSRLPVAVEYANRLDVSRMSFPVADRAGAQQEVCFGENVFRAGHHGVEDAVEAIAKVQRLAGRSRSALQAAVARA